MRRLWMCCLIAITGGASGDGMFVKPALTERVAGRAGVAATEQKGVVIELEDNREALLLQTTYHGPADRFAWVIPVPGRPGSDDVFLANTDYIDELLDYTKPEIVTHITDHGERGPGPVGMAEEAAPPAGAPGGMAQPPPPTVTVHERMDVGDYDVAVLSATGAGVLTDWLDEHKFHIPADSERVLAHYVAEQWYFVALRMQPGKVEQRPVLEDVAPIGIRFPTDRLVYPLLISRLSAREKTALLLVVLSRRQPVRCDQLPEVPLPLDKEFPKGTCYAEIRLDSVGKGYPGAVCEFCASPAMSYYDLHYEKGKWIEPSHRTGHLWATRLWTILDREDLEDLTFRHDASRREFGLTVERTGEVHRTWSSRIIAENIWPRDLAVSRSDVLPLAVVGILGCVFFLAGTWLMGRGVRLAAVAALPTAAAAVAFALLVLVYDVSGGIFLLVLALAAIPLLIRKGSGNQQGTGKPLSRLEIVWGAFVGAGLGFPGYTCLIRTLRPFASTLSLSHTRIGLDPWALAQNDLHGLLPIMIPLQIVWISGVGIWVWAGLWREGKKVLWVFVPWACLIALWLVYLVGAGRHGIGPGSVSYVIAEDNAAGVLLGGTTIAALLLTACFAIFGGLVSEKTRRLSQPLLYVVIGLTLFLSVTMMPGRAAHAGANAVITTGVQDLDEALNKLDDMLRRFVEANGCYPAKLSDMTGPDIPKQGVDSSGNAVEITRSLRNDTARELQGPLGQGWPIEALPTDPLTGRSDTWVYEPTGTPMIDSGGYRIRLFRSGAGHGGQSYYWGSITPPGPSLFDYTDGGGRPPRELIDASGTLSRVFELDDRTYRVLANARKDTWDLGTGYRHMDAWSVSPDGDRVAYAVNAEHTTHLFVAPICGGESRRLVDKPWPIFIHDIDWHPAKEQWLVVGWQRDVGDARSRIHVIDADGEPRAVSEPRYFLTARFAPDAEAIVAVIHQRGWSRGERDTPVEPGRLRPDSEARFRSWRESASQGRLYRLPLDGGSMQNLGHRVYADTLRASKRGVLVSRYEGPGRRLHLMWDDRMLDIESPENGSLLLDLIMADGAVIAAVAPSTLNRRGDIWRYDLKDENWDVVARWDTRDPHGSRPRVVKVIGEDRTRRKVLCLCRDDEDRLDLYSIDIDSRRVERLRRGGPAQEHGPPPVPVIGGMGE